MDIFGEKVDSLSSHTTTDKPPLSPSLQMSPFSQLLSSPKTHPPSTQMRGRSHSLPDIEADPQNFQVSQSAQTSSKPNGPPVFYPPGSYSYDIGYYNQLLSTKITSQTVSGDSAMSVLTTRTEKDANSER